MEEFVFKDGKKLRLGYTTGSCATAAAKAATYMLLTSIRKEKISITTPKGIVLNLDVEEIEMSENSVSCAIRKDSGDDPDVTSGTLIFAKVSFAEVNEIVIDGGFGVGRVTKSGLDQPVGNAAINSVPRKMIKENVEEVCKFADYTAGLSVVISVPDGENLAKKTFNPRLGIVGGISILGTTGIVEPMSEKALVDTIRVELKQKKANGVEYALITPGNYGMDFIKENLKIDIKKAVQVSNFIGDALDICVELGFKGVLLIGHVGKLIKIAGGMFNTHSKYGDCRMEIMASHAGSAGLITEKMREMLECVTCDDAIRILNEEEISEETFKSLSSKIDIVMNHKVREEIKVGAILFSKEYGLLCETEYARTLLNQIMEE